MTSVNVTIYKWVKGEAWANREQLSDLFYCSIGIPRYILENIQSKVQSF